MPPVRFQMHPGVDGAEEEVAGFGARPRAGDVVEDPGRLGPEKYVASGSPTVGTEPILTAVTGQLADDPVRPGVLPDDGVGHRLARPSVPHDRRLALVGHADGREIATGDPGLAQGAMDDRRRRDQISSGSCSTQPGLG